MMTSHREREKGHLCFGLFEILQMTVNGTVGVFGVLGALGAVVLRLPDALPRTELLLLQDGHKEASGVLLVR